MPPNAPLNSLRPDNDLGSLYLEDRNEAALQDTLTRWGSVAAGQQQVPAAPSVDVTTKESHQDHPFAKMIKGEPVQGETSIVGDVIRGTGKFIRDIPLQTIGAFRDAAQGAIDTGRGVADAFHAMGIPDAVIQYQNEAGEWDFDVMTRTTAEEKGGFKTELFDVPEGASAFSKPYRKMVQFLIPFSRVSKAMAATKVGTALVGSAKGTAAVDIVAGAVTDLVFWENQEAKLADMIESTRGGEFDLSNPVTAFLATDEDDPILVDKMKTALEGMGLAALTHAFIGGVKTVKTMRSARTQAKALHAEQAAAEEAQQIAKVATASDDQLKAALGAPDAPPVRFEVVDDATQQLAANDPLGRYTALYTVDEESAKLAAKQIEAAPGVQPATVPKNAIGRPIINFNTIQGSEDVDNVLKVMVNQFQDTAAKARGPIATNEETIAIAKELGIRDLMKVEAGRFNRGEILALKDVYTQSGSKLLEVAELATNAPTEANLFAFRKMLAIHEDILGRFVGAKAEAGRTLQALSIRSDSGAQERLQAISDVMESMGGTDVSLALAKKISELKDASPDALNEVVKRSAAAKTLDAVQEAWVMGLVSGPTSQARNIVSNAAFLFESAAERGVASRLPGATVEQGEATAFLFGAMQSLRQGFTNAGKAFANNTSGYGIGKVELPFRHAISSEAFGLDSHGMAGRLADFVGGYYRIFGRGLNAGDEFFKTLNYNGELWAQSLRQSKKEGLQGEEFFKEVTRRAMNPDESMRIAARATAQRNTFTKELGETGKQYQKLVGSMPALRFLTPFIRTPGNIFKEGFLRSPMALAMPKSFWAEVKKGGASKDLALAKVATGSAVMALFSDMASRGIVTGRGPLDPTERQRLRETGWAPYSLKVGDTWYNYRSIEPIGMVLGLAADTTELLHQHSQLEGSDDPREQEKADKMVAASIGAVGNSVTSATFMRGVSEFFEMMADPEMKAERWARNYAATSVPRMFKSIERAIDPELREVYTTMDAIADQIPWWGPTYLHPLRDLYGKPVTLSGAWGPDWISPIYTSVENASPVSRAIADIGIDIEKPSRTVSFMVDGEGSAPISLKNFPAVYDRYQVLAGNELVHPAHEGTFEQVANQMVEGKHDLSAIWESLPDTDISGVSDKGEFLKGLANEYRELARFQLMQEAQDALLKDQKDLTPLDIELISLRNEVTRRARFQREANMNALEGF